jgi:diketogulonate reductase-like aldo/keto reductase
LPLEDKIREGEMKLREDVIPIPGTKRRSYLEENVAAVNIPLTAKELRRLEEERYPVFELLPLSESQDRRTD